MKSLSYVALLRGINVGGNAIISMQDLKNAFGSLGFTNIRTILASGNVLFEASEENRVLLTRRIEQKLQSELGVGIFVMIRTIAEIQTLLESKPFKNIKISPQTKLHVSFLPLDLDRGLKVSERLQSTDFDVFRVSKSEVCSAVEISPNRGTSDLMKELEKQFGKRITTRTWNTVERIGKALGI